MCDLSHFRRHEVMYQLKVKLVWNTGRKYCTFSACIRVKTREKKNLFHLSLGKYTVVFAVFNFEGFKKNNKCKLTSQATSRLTVSPVDATWPSMPTPHGICTSLSVAVAVASHCTPSGSRNRPWAPLCTSNTLDTRHRRLEPLGGPSTKNSEAASQSISTVRLSTILCDSDLRSRSVAMSRTTVRKKSRSPCARRISRLASNVCADTCGHLGRRTFESINSDSMLIGLGGNDVNLSDNVFCFN